MKMSMSTKSIRMLAIRDVVEKWGEAKKPFTILDLQKALPGMGKHTIRHWVDACVEQNYLTVKTYAPQGRGFLREFTRTSKPMNTEQGLAALKVMENSIELSDYDRVYNLVMNFDFNTRFSNCGL